MVEGLPLPAGWPCGPGWGQAPALHLSVWALFLVSRLPFFRAAMVRGLPTHEGSLKPALRWSWPRRDAGRCGWGGPSRWPQRYMVVFRLPETVARAMVVGVAGPCRNLISLNAVSGHGQALASLGGIGESEAGIVATPRGFPRSVVVQGVHNGGPYRDFGLCSMAAYLCLSWIPAPYQGTGHAFDRRNDGTCECDGERPSSSRSHERSAQPSSGAVGCYCVAC